MRIKGIFVTGTDTGVGKTVVAAALVAAFREGGIDAAPMKPIQTGCLRRGGKLVAQDLEFALAAAGLEPSQAERRLMCPYRFAPACSPHLAAKLARRTISLAAISRSFRDLAARRELIVVEGAGGVLAPISGKKVMIDLIATLRLPVLLVARPGLGTINHTLLSLGELRRAGMPLLGVALCEREKTRRGFLERDNRKTIERLGGVNVLGQIEFIPGLGLRREPSLRKLAGQARPMAKAIARRLSEITP